MSLRHCKWGIVIVLILLAGCTDPSIMRPESDYKPLTLTFLQIFQSVDNVYPSYLGSLNFPHCGQNDNDFTIRMKGGREIYQIIPGAGEPTLKLVQDHKPWEGWDDLDPGQRFGTGTGAYHLVFANETATGGYNYSIHIYDFMMKPGPEETDLYGEWKDWTPIHRQDYWHNVTFTPFGSETLYEEGQRKGDGWSCRGTIPSGGN